MESLIHFMKGVPQAYVTKNLYIFETIAPKHKRHRC